MLREMCVGLLLLSLAVGASSVRVGVVGIIAALVMAIPTVLLLVFRHRAAAVALFFCTALLFLVLLQLQSVRRLFSLLFWIASLIMAGRASRATFKLHQFSAPVPPPAIDGRTMASNPRLQRTPLRAPLSRKASAGRSI